MQREIWRFVFKGHVGAIMDFKQLSSGRLVLPSQKLIYGRPFEVHPKKEKEADFFSRREYDDFARTHPESHEKAGA